MYAEHAVHACHNPARGGGGRQIVLARQPETKLLIQSGTLCPQPHVVTAWLTFLSFGPGPLWLVPSILPTKQQPQLHPHALNQLYMTYDT